MRIAPSTSTTAGKVANRGIVALAVVLAFTAETGHAQEEPPRRWSAAVTLVHPALRSGGDAGGSITWRSGSFRLQFDYARYVERESESGFYGEDEVRTLQWFTGAASWMLPRRGPIRPHVLAGGELFTDSTNVCAIVRRQGGDCMRFVHRRPGVHAGLGFDALLGSRFFARVQYLTSVVYVYERFAVGHRARVGAGIRF